MQVVYQTVKMNVVFIIYQDRGQALIFKDGLFIGAVPSLDEAMGVLI